MQQYKWGTQRDALIGIATHHQKSLALKLSLLVELSCSIHPQGKYTITLQ
jgi:hypothetical protein